MLDLDVRADIDGTEAYTSHTGVIEGEEFSDSFKETVASYLDNPDADQEAPTLRSEVGFDRIFRVIAYIESEYRHFYPSLYGEPKGAQYPRENGAGDGGLGIMQLTVPKATYLQAWNYKDNVDEAVRHLKSDLERAEAYPQAVKTDEDGCAQGPVLIDNEWFTPCRPMAPYKYDPDVVALDEDQLLMDILSLYNSNWHYWRWNKDRSEWIKYTSQHNAQQHGSNYADRAVQIIGNVDDNNPPEGF